MENKVKEWILSISKQEQLPDDIQAINFGLFETKDGYTIYMFGSKEFDPDNDDWATNEDFVPKKKYLEFKNEDLGGLSWQEFQNKIAEALRKFIESEDYAKSILQVVSHVATGFDEGDLHIVK